MDKVITTTGKETKMKIETYIKEELRKVSWMAWLIGLIPVPVGIVNASLLSRLVSLAVEGNVKDVLITGAEIIGLVFAARLVLCILKIKFKEGASEKTQNCKKEVYLKSLNASLLELYRRKEGDTKERLNDDFQMVIDKHLKLYPDFGAGLVTAFAYLIFLIHGSPFLGVVLVGIAMIQLLPPLVIKKFLQQSYDDTRDIEGEITDHIMEGVDGFAMIKVYGLQEWWMQKCKELDRKYLKIGMKSIYASETENALHALTGNFLQYGTYAIAGLFALYGWSSMEESVQAIAISAGLYEAVKNVFSSIPSFAVSRKAEKRLAELCEEEQVEEEISAEQQEDEKIVRNGNLHMTRLVYGYQQESGTKRLYERTEAVWKAGEKILIKGENGSGKSTFLKALLGMVPLIEGKVYFGEGTVSKLSKKNYPKNIFYLPQEDLRMPITARQLYQCTAGSSEKGQECIRIAKELKVTDALLEKTINQLSGGECKKVYLALSMALNPAFLFLDEPTNSLDKESKEVIKKLLKEYGGVCVIVSHEEVFDDLADKIEIMA